MATLPGMNVDLLALIVCSIWAIAIATIDLLTFRISNKSLALGALLAWPAFLFIGQEFHLTLFSFAFVVFALFCGFASLIGMGDVKLLAVLAFLVLPPDLASYQMFLVVGGLAALVSALFISRGDFRRSLQIPLAPAISIAAIISLFAK